MALKDILVHVDSTKYSKPRLEAALGLATAHGAHLTGLFVRTHPEVPQFIRAQLGAEVLEQQRKAMKKAAKTAEAEFRKVCEEAGQSFEWRSAEGDLAENLALHARYTDMVVVGQRSPEGDEVPGASELPDRLVLGAGRPVLVVPYIGAIKTLGERIMVAWDASRLATRAVNDALPLLKRAKKVCVLAVNPKGGEEGHGDVPGADICLHLARHKVNAEAQHIVADDMDPGEMILSRCADEGCDMLVMGAYGHRRWRELVLGGVTRHMLQHMTVPVLMSH